MSFASRIAPFARSALVFARIGRRITAALKRSHADESQDRTRRTTRHTVRRLRLCRGLAGVSGTQEGQHLRGEGNPAHLAEGRPEGSLDGSCWHRLRGTGRQRRQGLPAGPRRRRRGQTAVSRLRHREGAVELRFRRAWPVRPPWFAHVAGGRREHRVHVRTARRSLRRQHGDPQTNLEQERLERERWRAVAQVGPHPEPVGLSQPRDRRRPDTAGGRRGVRQGDRRTEMEVTGAAGPGRLREPLAREGGRRGSPGDDDGREGIRP